MRMTCTHTSDTDTSTMTTGDALDDAGIIPFADECVPPSVKPKPASGRISAERDSAREAFGPVRRRPSMVDRELGIERNKLERRGQYACPCCKHRASRVVRVRVPTQSRWTAVCAVCAAMLLAKAPGTIVGGMVRPTRRRRRTAPGHVAHGFRRVDQNHYRRAG